MDDIRYSRICVIYMSHPSPVGFDLCNVHNFSLENGADQGRLNTLEVPTKLICLIAYFGCQL